MKVLKAGKLLYEDGGFMLDGWEFDETASVGEMIDMALIFIAEERLDGQEDDAADKYATTQTLNAERLMIDAIQQAKK